MKDTHEAQTVADDWRYNCFKTSEMAVEIGRSNSGMVDASFSGAPTNLEISDYKKSVAPCNQMEHEFQKYFRPAWCTHEFAGPASTTRRWTQSCNRTARQLVSFFRGLFHHDLWGQKLTTSISESNICVFGCVWTQLFFRYQNRVQIFYFDVLHAWLWPAQETNLCWLQSFVFWGPRDTLLPRVPQSRAAVCCHGDSARKPGASSLCESWLVTQRPKSSTYMA